MTRRSFLAQLGATIAALFAWPWFSKPAKRPFQFQYSHAPGPPPIPVEEFHNLTARPRKVGLYDTEPLVFHRNSTSFKNVYDMTIDGLPVEVHKNDLPRNLLCSFKPIGWEEIPTGAIFKSRRSS